MRIKGLDIFRGLAIVLMVIYHFCYFLNEYGYIHQNMNEDIIWRSFRAIIITIFLFSAGVSLHLAYSKTIDYKKLAKRVTTLSFISLTITIITKIVYPGQWVYFGIIHFIAFASLIAILFINRFWLSITTASILAIGYYSDKIPYSWLLLELKKPLDLPEYTVDLAPIFPWFWVIAFALAVSAKGWHVPFLTLLEKLFNKREKLLIKLGQNSLIIYLTHLAILFAIFEAISHI